MTMVLMPGGEVPDDGDASGTEGMVRRLVDLLSCDVAGLTDGELAEALVAIDSLGSRISARRSELVDRWDASMVWPVTAPAQPVHG